MNDSSIHLLNKLFTYLFINSGASRRECAYIDDELVEFFQEYDELGERDGLLVLRLSTNAVEEGSVEASTMLLASDDVDDVDDSGDFPWKEILIT